MFCGQCGNQMPEDARFCSACGASLAATAQPAGSRQLPAQPLHLNRLVRPRANRMIAGVCAGLAQHYGWDLTWVRVITVLLAVFSSGAGLIAYIVFWLVMPEEPYALPSTTSYPRTGPPPAF